MQVCVTASAQYLMIANVSEMSLCSKCVLSQISALLLVSSVGPSGWCTAIWIHDFSAACFSLCLYLPLLSGPMILALSSAPTLSFPPDASQILNCCLLKAPLFSVAKMVIQALWFLYWVVLANAKCLPPTAFLAMIGIISSKFFERLSSGCVVALGLPYVAFCFTCDLHIQAVFFLLL